MDYPPIPNDIYWRHATTPSWPIYWQLPGISLPCLRQHLAESDTFHFALSPYSPPLPYTVAINRRRRGGFIITVCPDHPMASNNLLFDRVLWGIHMRQLVYRHPKQYQAQRVPAFPPACPAADLLPPPPPPSPSSPAAPAAEQTGAPRPRSAPMSKVKPKSKSTPKPRPGRIPKSAPQLKAPKPPTELLPKSTFQSKSRSKPKPAPTPVSRATPATELKIRPRNRRERAKATQKKRQERQRRLQPKSIPGQQSTKSAKKAPHQMPSVLGPAQSTPSPVVPLQPKAALTVPPVPYRPRLALLLSHLETPVHPHLWNPLPAPTQESPKGAIWSPLLMYVWPRHFPRVRSSPKSSVSYGLRWHVALLAKAKARAWDLITALDDLGGRAVLRMESG